MVYYKKRTFKSRRPGYKACGRMVAGDAAKALSIARGIKRLINVEIKNFDTQLTQVTVTDTPVITQLTNIGQGDTTITRDGSQIKMIGFELNYFITRSASSDFTIVRVMVVLDKQTNQAIYTAADLLADVTAQDNVIAPRNLNNKKRFTVLYDRKHSIGSGGAGSIVVKKYFKKEIMFRYDANTPSIADMTQNSLSMLCVSNEVTNDPGLTLHARVRFVDN